MLINQQCIGREPIRANPLQDLYGLLTGKDSVEMRVLLTGDASRATQNVELIANALEGEARKSSPLQLHSRQ